jgi:hypothetical protein
MTAEAFLDAALIEEATKKSGLIWPSVGPAARPVWHAWADGAAYVLLAAPGVDGVEQRFDELAGARSALVTVRSKDKGGRLTTWEANVRSISAQDDAWPGAVENLAGGRLNAPDGDQQTARWARECVIVRLEPTGAQPERPGAMPQGSLAAAPAPTPATTRGPLPKNRSFGKRRPR